uniref:Uncharacterized protein n=1 Tax=Oryza nivara TaxID=4536 RepID=A0A0E0HDF4_ORYNI
MAVSSSTSTCSSFSLLLLLLLLAAAPWRSGEAAAATTAARALNFTRQDFPGEFVFGAGTSAYQYEGATDEDGRSPSIWDTFTHAGKMPDKSTGDMGAGGYHRYKEDVKLMSDTSLEAYRFSISWSRLIPRGRGPVNPKGLEYYNSLIDELVERGIEIHVTLYHLDFPQILEDEYHGWLSPRVIDDFTAYADVCFREFGDRVRHWTTMDEPNVLSIAAYDSGAFPPCRCSPPFGANCTAGNSTVEPYVVAHNSILAHASVTRLYRDKYQATQKGFVGMNIYSFWNYPFSSSSADIAATQRALDFMVGWILDPLVYGDYPEIMKKKAGSRIPSFTEEQSELIRGSADFIGINHYTSVYISDASNGETVGPRDYSADMAATFRISRNDTPSGQFVPTRLPRDPKGLQCMLEYLRDTYQGIPVYIQENGKNGANVKGYFVWSFLDVFELLAGYHSPFGLHYVDFEDPNLPRQPKLSAHWYSKFLRDSHATAEAALNFTRQDFPGDFVFGAGTSAYQYEGATGEDGRTPSIWDTFTHSGRMADNSTGDRAAAGYHKYKEDVKLMSDTGLEAYRFSISWSRLIPRGRGPINPKGLEYYNDLIDKLVKRGEICDCSMGIEIHVTLYHLDFPQALQDEYNGWLSPRIIEDFTAYADVCFREFGDRVRHWTTVGEPNVLSIAGYDSGVIPPCRCSPPFGTSCAAGDSTVEPYVAAHNSILAHASAVRLYRDKYQAKQKSVVGTNIYSFWPYPLSRSCADIDAVQRVLDFTIGWILDPLVYGDYPEIMKKQAGSRIPSFTKEQSELIRGSADFIAMDRTAKRQAFGIIMLIWLHTSEYAPSKTLSDPKGLQCMLEYLKDTYEGIPVYVQENGKFSNSISIHVQPNGFGQFDKEDSLNDTERVEYLSSYMGGTLAALRNGANVKGYFVWSFLDVFELFAGYHSPFGLHHVDFEDPSLPRQPKLSAQWYSKFLRSEIGINIEKIISPDEHEHAYYQ